MKKLGLVVLGSVVIIASIIFPAACVNQDSDKSPSSLEQSGKPKGLDIMLLLDCSFSMQNRSMKVAGKNGDLQEVVFFDVMKRIAGDTIRRFPKTRFGIIGFTSKPFLICPLTTDQKSLLESLDKMKMDIGSAMAPALVDAVKTLDSSQAQERIIVLITDGDDNLRENIHFRGETYDKITPFIASRYAYAKGIRIFPVEIRKAKIQSPRRIATRDLYNVAIKSKGQFFQAVDYNSLDGLYKIISQLSQGTYDKP